MGFIFLTLFGSILLLFCGNKLGKLGSIFLVLFLNLLSLICSTFQLFFIFFSNSIFIVNLHSWIKVSFLNITLGFYIDHLSATMITLILFISFLVQIYSVEYMSKDPFFVKFMSYLSLFTFSMLIFVSSNNLLQMFLGWEAVGICSYLLISFWNTRLKANKAALKAVFVNRIGDCFFLLAIVLIIFFFGTVEFDVLYSLLIEFSEENFEKQKKFVFQKLNFFKLEKNNLIFFNNFDVFTCISFCLLIAVCCKSAQFGFHTWLPDAMEGPTPVSALLHAATMVTAGIFLVLRCFIFFEFSELVLTFLTIIGSITSFFASTIGVFQNDLKKIIAYSTCSQLGYMLAICGLSYYNLSFFHLVNHAFFKALLFLSAGVVIHSLNDEQDIRKMGGLYKVMPLTFIFFLIGCFALIGLPFLSGFYSKDFILEYCYATFFFSVKSQFFAILGTLSVFLTSFYSFKILFLVFLTEPRMSKSIFYSVHEPSFFMMGPIFILSLFSLFFGFYTRFFFIDLGIYFFHDFFFLDLYKVHIFFEQSLFFFVKHIPLFFTLLGFFVSFFCYYLNIGTNFVKFFLKKKHVFFFFFFFFLRLYEFFCNKWYFDFIYNRLILEFFFFFFIKVQLKL